MRALQQIRQNLADRGKEWGCAGGAPRLLWKPIHSVCLVYVMCKLKVEFETSMVFDMALALLAMFFWLQQRDKQSIKHCRRTTVFCLFSGAGVHSLSAHVVQRVPRALPCHSRNVPRFGIPNQKQTFSQKLGCYNLISVAQIVLLRTLLEFCYYSSSGIIRMIIEL